MSRKILIIKSSSMGDVIHALPVAFDIKQAQPDAEVHWVVEESFADIPDLSPFVDRKILTAFRRWRKHPLARQTRSEFSDLKRLLRHEKYDCVICFMLLQELPPVTKSKVINNALNLVKDGGNVIFIDHHSPYWWNPLRYFIRMYNRLYNPFVEKLWDRGIETFAKNKFDYIWRKSTYFGGIYQKVVATKKTGPLEGMQDPEPHKDNFFFED